MAALAAGDLEPIARTEADALVATCDDCAELLADLTLIAAATAALPDVPRTRDFRLTAADAARLRPRGWRALVDAIGGARAGFTRPLAAGLTTLGLVGLLVTTLPGALGGQAGASTAGAPNAAPDDGAGNGYSYASAAASNAGVAPVAGQAASAAPSRLALGGPSAAATTDNQGKSVAPNATDRVSVEAVGTTGPAFFGGVQPPGTKGGRGTGGGATASGGATTDESTAGGLLASNTGNGGSLLLPISIVCLVAGLGLFALRWGARQLARR